MTSDPITLLLLIVVLILMTIVSGSMPLYKSWERKHIRLFISFGAGSLLGASFIHMIPETVEAIGSGVGIAVLTGFLILYVIEKFTMIHACEGEDCSFHQMGIISFIGLSAHNIIDGFVLTTSTMLPNLGPIVFAAIVVHKIPASFSLSSILIIGEFTRKKVLLYLIIFSLMLPVGAFAAMLLIDIFGTYELGIAVAVSAGTFIYIATSDLLPEVHRVGEWRFQNLISFLVGIVFMGGIKWIAM